MCWVDVVKFTPMSQGVRIVNFPIIPARRQDSTTNPFQLYRAATVANLTLMAGKLGLTDDTGDDPLGNHVIGAELVNTVATFRAIQLGHIWSLAFLTSALLPQSHFPNQPFRPDF